MDEINNAKTGPKSCPQKFSPEEKALVQQSKNKPEGMAMNHSNFKK